MAHIRSHIQRTRQHENLQSPCGAPGWSDFRPFDSFANGAGGKAQTHISSDYFDRYIKETVWWPQLEDRTRVLGTPIA